MTIIETERLILRTWKDEDIHPFARINADSIVMEYFPKLLTLQETSDYIEKIKAHFKLFGFGLFAVELKKTSQCIGFIGLMIPPSTLWWKGIPCVEIGWRLDHQYWNQGYATEGAKAVLQYGFNTLKLKEIVSFTAKVNTRSIRIMEKCGMQRDFNGDFLHPTLPKDHKLAPHVLYRSRTRA